MRPVGPCHGAHPSPPQPAPAIQAAPFNAPNIPHLRATQLITPVGDWPFDTPTTLPTGGIKGGFDGPIR